MEDARKAFLKDPSIFVTLGFILVFTISVFFTLNKIPLGQGSIMIVAGYFLWGLSEYLINRGSHIFTKRKAFFVGMLIDYHFKHHKNPMDFRFAFIHPFVISVLVCLSFIISSLAIGDLALPLISGFILGYLVFLLLHILQHQYPAPRIGFLQALWHNHFLHHSYYPELAFGVSTRLWDYVFGTLPPKHLFVQVKAAGSLFLGSSLIVQDVNDQKTEEIFLKLPESIYRSDPNWVPALKPEIRKVFKSDSNPYFKHGTARRWIIVNGYGEVVGRIAAFVNFEKMHEERDKVGGIGFFECTNDKKVANRLFGVAIAWLQDNFKINLVEGPINFGENDKYWGLLIKGFVQPSYGMNYNPPYYEELFEAYGFKVQFKQLTNTFDLTKSLPERFTRIAVRVINNNQFIFRPFRYKNNDSFVNDFVEVYNQAWSSFANFRPMDVSIVRNSLSEIKPILEEDFIWFAYSNSKPIGFIMALPDINNVVKYAGDEFDWKGKLKFLYYKGTKGFSRIRVVVMGIVPKFQNRGIESGLIYHAYQEGLKRPQYKKVELSWVGDFNEKMIAIHHAMGAVEDKQHATYRKHLGG